MDPKLNSGPLGVIRFKQCWDGLLGHYSGSYFTTEERLRLADELEARLSMYRVVDHLGGDLHYGEAPQKTHCIFHEDNHHRTQHNR